jgi:hypothetical protein
MSCPDIAFDEIDTSDDRKISRAEFAASVDKIRSWYVLGSFLKCILACLIPVPQTHSLRHLSLLPSPSRGVRITNPETAFAEIDRDRGGMILFEEFAEWAIKQHLDTDGDGKAD